MIKFRELKTSDKKEIEKLFEQLTNKKIKLNVKSLVKDKNIHCLILEHRDGIIGFGSLVLHQVPTKGRVARIEDVVIHEKYRGKGYGRKITENLIIIAKKKKIKLINLNSNPRRIEARKLYESIGFKLVDTGLFKLEL